ncbi:MAG: permease of phosphate ABC transporter [Lachnospiraceae bacterium]|nr:permease of phosphate ABC transporter [Lachnospiraceae bacterium]
MKNLFCYADKYLQKSNWKDMAMLKFCLFSIGILIGMRIPEKGKKKVGIAALLVFLITYIPLMAKFIGIVITENRE